MYIQCISVTFHPPPLPLNLLRFTPNPHLLLIFSNLLKNDPIKSNLYPIHGCGDIYCTVVPGVTP